MRIVCDSCSTKYSIADEKVRGKVFKIRCKKCEHIIVVRGDNQPANVVKPVSAALPATETAVWHLVIDREQVGPLEAAAVREKFQAGQIDAETYIWREGFADWLRLGSIEEFRDLQSVAPPVIAPPSAPPAKAQPAAAASTHEDATRRTDVANLLTAAPAAADKDNTEEQVEDDPSALFGTPAPLYAGAAATASPSTQMATASSEAEPMIEPVYEAAPVRRTPLQTPAPLSRQATAAAATPMPAVDPQSLTGQRNETSMLFSLSNLQALSAGNGHAKAAEPRPGYANSKTEGSGLIDIRAMAASTLAAKPNESRREELAGPPVFSPISAPVLLPPPSSGMPGWLIGGLVGLGGLAVIGVLGFVYVSIVRPAPTLTTAPVVAPTPAAVAPTPPTTMAAENAKPATPAPAATTPATPAPPAGAVAPVLRGKRNKLDKEPKTAKADRAHPVTAAPALTPAPATPAPAAAAPATGKGDEIDILLNGPKKQEHHQAAADENLPEQLGKQAIVAGMHKISGRVQACHDQYNVPGMAMVKITIAHSGHVGAAHVSGIFTGTPTGSCVEKAVKGASFPRFRSGDQTIDYPFNLR